MAAVADLVVASAVVRNGRMFIRSRRTFDQQIAQMKDGVALEVTVKQMKATRSLQANSYYWGVVVEWLVRHCDHSYTPLEMHELLKAKFLPKTLAIHDGNGEIVFEYVIGGSTRKMNNTQFSEYIREVKQWAWETLELDIPEPEGAF